MGIALMVDPKALMEVRQDAENYLVLIKSEPGKPFVYYMGAAWDKGLDFHDRASWETYVREQTAGLRSEQTMSSEAAPARVGRYRWMICALLFAATAINYVDRQTIGVLKPTLQGELKWTESSYADIVFWFQAAYAIG